MRRQPHLYFSGNIDAKFGGVFALMDFICGWGALAFGFVAVTASLDPFRFVFEEFLPHPYNRTPVTTCAGMIVQIALSTLCTWEHLRFIVFVGILLAVLTLIGLSFIKIMLKLPGPLCIQIYNHARIILASVFRLLGDLGCAITVVMHVLTIFLFWVGLRTWNDIPLPICLGSLALGMILFIM